MIKKIFLLSFMVFAAALSACKEEKTAATTPPANTRPLTVISSDGKTHSFNVEMALTPEKQALGLMHRTELADNAGMLFLFPGEAERAFYMKNTLIPLDMIFIRMNGVIHHIHENAIPQDLTSIPSNGPVHAVLEVKGGPAAKLGLKPGDTIAGEMFPSAASIQ